MNGQRFDTRRYPKLAQKYPSGQLPDMRGEFIRGWDNGRGVDAGRGVLSAQSDAIRNITGEHGISQYADNDHMLGAFNSNNTSLSNGIFERRNIEWNDRVSLSAPHREIISFDASRVVPTANENRPRNIAYHYICLAE